MTDLIFACLFIFPVGATGLFIIAAALDHLGYDNASDTALYAFYLVDTVDLVVLILASAMTVAMALVQALVGLIA